MNQVTRAIIQASLVPGLCICSLLVSFAADPSPVDYADPMVGTDAHGHVFPGATVPFGLVQLSPDTGTEDWDHVSGYHYPDSTIQGFSHTHLLGTGCGDLGDILIMPTVGEVHLDPGQPGNGYISRFSHANETAKPGYYRVFLDDPKVTAELTATARTGFHRYTFPTTDQAHLILDLVHAVGDKPYEAQLTVENNTTISGYRKTHGWSSDRAVYFVAEFSPPFTTWGIEENGQRKAPGTTHGAGERLKAYFNYSTASNRPVLVKVGISPTSIDGARTNLRAENPGWDFDGIRAAARDQWNAALGTIDFTTSDPHLLRTFYTNLYLSLLAPTLNNDVDGSYRGMDHRNHSSNVQNYTEYSLWDTYRAENPLLELVQPQRVGDMMQGLLTEYREAKQHSTPIWPLWSNETWCMVGYHSVDEMVDAYTKGFNIGDPETAYQAMRDTAMQDRNGLDDYKRLGYVASEPHRQATSVTLEYAYDDWCLARMAEALGHADDAAMFYKRAGNYRNVFDQSTLFMRGRKADGSWRTPFDKRGLVGDEYVEADAWQYALSVQQDVPGLIATYGGDAGLIDKLDALFMQDSTVHGSVPDISGLIGQYSQGDEQCHHVAYLYDYAGQPWKTQQHVRQVMATLYDDTPAGQCGNVDCGEMSAWYVLSALGFFPVNPASGVYDIGSPVMDKAVLHLDPTHFRGKTFTITALNNSPQNIYIQSAVLNGSPLAGPWFTYDQMSAGGTLQLTMGRSPNKAWGLNASARPPATMPLGFEYAPLPPPAPPDPTLARQVPMRIICGSDQAAGDFIVDPNMEDGATNADPNAHIDTSAPHSAPAAVYQSERYGSDFRYVLPVPPGGSYLVRLHFDELFDDANGMRVENIAVNDQPALTNFDIFSVAHAERKAVVEDIPAVTPDAKGNIVIHITAAKNSPDQNAKIDGIEVLPMSAAGVSAMPATSPR